MKDLLLPFGSLVLLLLLFQSSEAFSQKTLVPWGSIWKYRDMGEDPGPHWIEIGYPEAEWLSGPAELGYGDGDEATVVSYGPHGTDKYVTTYFRKTFTVTDPGHYFSLRIRLLTGDGALVFLNGIEVFQSNLPEGPITSSTPTLSAVSGEDEKHLA